MTEARRRGRPPRATGQASQPSQGPQAQAQQEVFDESLPSNSDGQGLAKGHKTVHDWIEKIVSWLLFVISIPFTIFGSVMEQLMSRSVNGSRVVGGLLFALGVMLSADSIWQGFFQQPALFPWFEPRWIGLTGWFIVWLNPAFYAAILIAVVIASVEAKAIRGKGINQAKRDYDQVKGFTVPDAPGPNSIDAVRFAWGDLKRAGTGTRKQGNMFTLMVWLADIGSTFYSRNPLDQGNVAFIIIVAAYNLFVIMAAEYGLNMWKEFKKQTNEPQSPQI